MWRVVWTVVSLAVVGCTPAETDETDVEVPENFLAFGDIQAEDSMGEVRIRKAFGMATNGHGGIYLAANEAATCARVVEYLQTHDSPFNPSDMLEPGECNMTFAFEYDDDVEEGWDGVTYTQADALSAIWSINCAMDEGEFKLETRQDHRDYYWSGPWWQGDPTIYSATVTGNQAEMKVGLEFDMSEYTGNFIYDELREVPADGLVDTSEVIETRWCPELVWTSLFPF